MLSQTIQRVVSVHWTGEIAQFRLLTLEVQEFGPATVAIDAHGHSLYTQLRERAAARLGVTRASSAGAQ